MKLPGIVKNNIRLAATYSAKAYRHTTYAREWLEDIGIEPGGDGDTVLDQLLDSVELNGSDPEGFIKFLEDYIKDWEERRCRVCGCTQNNACPGGCWWVEEDLCSRCDGEEKRYENT